MDRYGLIGYPISHSLSPQLFSEAYDGLLPYELVETPDFDEAWDIFIRDFKAVNVTMPFKSLAAARADIIAKDVERTGSANILVKENGLVKACNSDCYAVARILGKLKADHGIASVAIIGTGGAGRAAFAASEDCGLETSVFHHDGIKDGACADIIIYTLPSFVEGARHLKCRFVLEANYRNPSLESLNITDPEGRPAEYIGGKIWLRAQAAGGFETMTGQKISDNFTIWQR